MSEKRADRRTRLAELEAELHGWSSAHPDATLEAIEREVDRRLRALRADVLVSVVGTQEQATGTCPDCGLPLVRRGSRVRSLRTDGDQPIALDRSYASCPVCGHGLSPLDERLGLLPGSHVTPGLVAGMVRLGALIPFGQVPGIIQHFTGVTVSAETVRRLTDMAGAAQVERDSAAVAQIERELPTPPSGPALQLLSVDGAMVSLVGGTWTEVKTLALGTVAADPLAPSQVRTRDLSYFSRRDEAASFTRLATVETHRRRTETAQTVVAVVDGAACCQGFIDHQRHDAVRVLDYAHAMGYLGQAAQALFGTGTAAASEWRGRQAHALRHGQAEAVLRQLTERIATSRDEAREMTQTTAAYLRSRLEQIRYQTFVNAGYPIGSGCVESANKLVVEARLKGSGMHWAAEHINPMLALRTLTANERWEERWPDIRRGLRQQAAQRSQQRRQLRQTQPPPAASPEPPPATPLATTAITRAKLVVDGKPTQDHPWRRY